MANGEERHWNWPVKWIPLQWQFHRFVSEHLCSFILRCARCAIVKLDQQSSDTFHPSSEATSFLISFIHSKQIEKLPDNHCSMTPFDWPLNLDNDDACISHIALAQPPCSRRRHHINWNECNVHGEEKEEERIARTHKTKISMNRSFCKQECTVGRHHKYGSGVKQRAFYEKEKG